MISPELREAELARQAARRSHEAAQLVGAVDPYRFRPPGERRPPEIVLRLAEVSEVPRGALSAQARLQRAGWAVWPTYCRGFAPNGKLVDSLALRCDRLVRRADGRPFVIDSIGIWLDGSWEIGWIGSPWGGSYGMRAWVATMTHGWAGWLTARSIRA